MQDLLPLCVMTNIHQMNLTATILLCTFFFIASTLAFLLKPCCLIIEPGSPRLISLAIAVVLFTIAATFRRLDQSCLQARLAFSVMFMFAFFATIALSVIISRRLWTRRVVEERFPCLYYHYFWWYQLSKLLCLFYLINIYKSLINIVFAGNHLLCK